MEYAPKGVNEDIVRLISEKNGEPEWMTDWRLQAFKRWKQMDEPDWAMVDYPPIDYQDQYYYARPRACRRSPSRSTRSIRSCCAPMKSSASR
jgi:Fe-S cluster assembly protein SufB